MKSIFLTKNPSQTKKLGEVLAREVLKTRPAKQSFVFGLKGDLGGGKTTFLQGFAKGLGIEEKILSPTFVIIKRFHISHSLFRNFYHFDCYRIQKIKEISNLGFQEIVSDPKNIVVVEWADRIKKNMPRGTLWLNFEFIGNKARKIIIK